MGFCKSCGKTLNEGAKFCPSCGATVTPEAQIANQETASTTDQKESPNRSVSEKPKKSFFKTPIFIVLVIFLLGASTVAAALILNKSPKERYLLSEYKTYEKAKEEIEEKYGENFEFQEKMMESPSTSEFELSGDIEIDSAEGDPSYNMIREILQSAKIKAEMNQDPVKKEGHYKLALNMEDEEAIEAEFYESKKKMGISIPVLYDTFFYINSNEYGEFMRMMDPLYEGPEELDLSQVTLEDLKLNEKEQDYLKERYSKFLLDRLKDDDFSEKKNVEYKHKGAKMELRELTLKLSPKETKQLMDDFLDHLIKDEKFHDIIIKRVMKLSESAMFMEDVDEDVFNKATLKKEMVNGLKNAKKEMESVEYPEGFTSTILVDKKEYIVDRKMKFAVGDGTDHLTFVINSKDVPDGDDKRYEELSVEMSPYEKESGNDIRGLFKITNDITAKKDNRTEDLKVSFLAETDGEKESEFIFDMKSDFKGENNSKQDIKRDFKFNIDGRDFSSPFQSLGGTIKQKNDVSVKDKHSKQKFNIEIELEDDFDSGKLVLNLDSNTKLKDKVKMPNLDNNAKGATNVVDLSENDFMEIFEEITINLMTLGETFGISPDTLFGNDDYYSEYDEDFDMDMYEEDYLDETDSEISDL